MAQDDKRPLKTGKAVEPAAVTPQEDDQAWHDELTKQAIKEADAGDFATSAELKATVRKFVSDG